MDIPVRFQVMIISQQQNAMGSLHNIYFSVFWASWGPSGKEPGSGNRFRFRVTGFAVPGNQVLEPSPPGFNGFQQVLQFQGSGFRRSRARKHFVS